MKRNSLLFKLILSSLILMLLPFIVIISLVSSYFIKTALDEKKAFNFYVTNDIAYSVDSTISAINNISISIVSSNAIREFLLSDISVGNASYFSLYTNAASALQTLSLQEPSLADIYILTNHKKTLHSDSNYNTAFTSEEIVKMDKSIGVWFWSHEKGKLAMCRAIRNTNNLKDTIAYLKIVIDPDAIYKHFNSKNISEDMSFALLDTDGTILLHNLSQTSLWLADEIEGKPSLLSEYNAADFLVSQNSSSYNILPQKLKQRNTYVVAFAVDKTKEYHQLLYKIVIFLISLFVILASIQAFIYNRLFINPITVLGNLMKSIESEDFSVRFELKASDEIQTLANKFNMMSAKLQFLHDEVYQNNLKLKDSEIKNLLSEINPHFLYNVFDSICWMIELKDTNNAVLMVQKLSSLFRLSLYRSPDGLIPFEKELEHAKSYIAIQQLRFNKIEFTLDVQEGLEKIYVMKLVLQPILENAIKHGLAPVGGQGEILLAVYTQDNDIIYYIYDSGVGINPEKIQGLLEENNISVGTDGLALTNVNERLKLMFGKSYGISCHSPSEKGSIFIVRQPITYKGDPKDD